MSTDTEACPPTDPKQKHRERALQQRKRRPFYNSLHNAKYRARKAGIPCTITEEYLESIFTGVCPAFGTRLSLPNQAGGDALPHTARPSLDRIQPELGYVVGNVIWISLRANQIKNDATYQQIRQVSDWLEQTMKEIEQHAKTS